MARFFFSEMGSLGFSRELQFQICHLCQQHESPFIASEGECFYREETEVGRVKEFVAFHWLSPYQEREAFLLSGSAIIIVRESALFWSPDSIDVSVYFLH